MNAIEQIEAAYETNSCEVSIDHIEPVQGFLVMRDDSDVLTPLIVLYLNHLGDDFRIVEKISDSDGPMAGLLLRPTGEGS